MAAATAKSESTAKTAQENLDKYHKGAALSETLALIHDDFKDVSKPMLSNMLKISYNDQGQVITTFEHDGVVIANNVTEFKSWASEQSSFKKILNGVNSSGAGANQSNAASGGNSKNYSEMSLQEQIAHNKNINPQRN